MRERPDPDLISQQRYLSADIALSPVAWHGRCTDTVQLNSFSFSLEQAIGRLGRKHPPRLNWGPPTHGYRFEISARPVVYVDGRASLRIR